MSNEVVVILTIVFDLGFVLVASRFGRDWLMMAIAVNILLISTFGAKLAPMFGFVTNVGNVFYAAVFLATHMLIERYGEDTGYRSIWLGLGALVLFLAMAQFTIWLATIPATAAFAEAIRTVFAGVPRIALASMAAYLGSQYLNVWLYSWLRGRTGGRKLWLRDNTSNILGQFVDSIIFFTAAFYGTVRPEVLVQALLIGFAMKVLVGLVGTGFLYASTWRRWTPAP